MDQDNFSCFNDFSDAEKHIELAHDYYEFGRWQEALHELQAALDINPSNSNWLFNKGLTLDTLEQYYEAIESYELAHALNPDDVEVLNCLAIDYTRVGQYEQALKIFEELEEIAPDFEPGYCNRIITYSEIGQHEKAEEMFYLARQLKEHCPLCYYNIGNSLFSRKLYDRAIWCWQQTLRLDPHHPMVNYRIAHAYWAKGEPSLAREHFLAELRRHPGDIEVLLDTGILLLENNDLEAAQEKFNRILEQQPNHAQALHYLGEIHLHNGRISQAIECFHQAVSFDRKQNGSHYRLGECYLKLGQKANAREHLLAELRLSPQQPEVLLDLGCLLQEAEATVEAMNCFEKVTQMRPQEPSGYHYLSVCYYLAGLIEQGIELSLEVLQHEPNHFAALYNLAYAYRQKKDYHQANEYARRASIINPHDRQLKKLQYSTTILSIYSRISGLLCRVFRRPIAKS